MSKPRGYRPTKLSNLHPTADHTVIEQAIAKHGPVWAAAVKLGLPLTKVKAVYDAMEGL